MQKDPFAISTDPERNLHL